MMLLNTALVFFQQPVNLTILIVGWTFALLSFLYWKEKQKTALLYAHVFFLLVPLLHFAITVPCNLSLLQGLKTLCSVSITQFVIYLIPAGLVGALLVGTVVVPWAYRKAYRAREVRDAKLERAARKAGVRKPRVFVLDTAKPLAFSHGRNVFVSVGMHEILDKKECEAVLLHELGHIRNRASLSKLSAWIARLVSPLAFFSPMGAHIAREERSADAFAARVQGTRKHVRSAKKKVDEFLRCPV